MFFTDLISRLWAKPDPDLIVLGHALSPYPTREYRFNPAQHGLITAATGQGKTAGYVKSVALQCNRRHHGVSVVEPHDAARQIIAHLVELEGASITPKFFDRNIYIRFGTDHVPPFNILQSHQASPEDVAHATRDAFARLDPTLDGAAMFEALCAPAALALAANGLPLPLMGQLLRSPGLRQACLQAVDNPAVHEVFRMLPDDPLELERWVGSVSRRITTLNFDSIAFHSLVNPDNVVQWRTFMDAGVTVLIDLSGISSPEVKRSIASLIFTAYERAAFTRIGLPPEERPHNLLVVDEFPAIAPRDGRAIEAITSQLRKASTSLHMVCQATNQLSDAGLTAAMENVGLIVNLGLGRDSAEAMAPAIVMTDPELVKWEALTDITHDELYTHAEQVTTLTQDLRHLPPRHAVVSQRGKPPVCVRLLDVPDPQPNPGLMAEVLDEFRRRYHRTFAETRTTAIDAIRATGLPVDLELLFGDKARRSWADPDQVGFGVPLGEWAERFHDNSP